MTRMLFMDGGVEGNYVRSFRSCVTEAGEGYVVLAETAFYPEGGGQPSDAGTLSWDGGTARVRSVSKKNGVRHAVDVVPPVGTEVAGELDWELRHAHMRMHTSQHIVSGVAYDLRGARTVGNQIKSDSSRLDLCPFTEEPELIAELEAKANEVIARNIEVRIFEEERVSLLSRTDPLRSNLDLIPPTIPRLRVVEIPGFDICPCAGTHVRSTSEIGRVRITETEKKGKDRVRVRYSLASD